MSSMNFNTANKTFRQLLGNGLTYSIPKFQRDYSWSQDEWDDLWQDILGLEETRDEPAHYMGYLVLQTSNNKQFDVIDGQQRLTTISILILASLGYLKALVEKGIDPEINEKRKENLRGGYIGYVDPVTLISRSKLVLNRHNNKFYQNYLVPLEKMPQRGLNASEHLLRKAYLWFFDRIKSYVGDSGEKVAAFIDSIVDKLFFTVIEVTDELNAFKVFETLNARGVRLSSTDLLKNYLFSVVASSDEHELEVMTLEERWETIVGQLSSESFPEFLRAYWNSRNKIVRKSDLFKTIRKQVSTREEVFTLIRNLETSASVYAALRNPADPLWEEKERSDLEKLQMFNVRQPLPLLMRIFELSEASDRPLFKKILSAVVSFSFRYNVICNRQTHDQERLYNFIATALNKNENRNETFIISEIKTLYPEDAEFKTAFKEKELSTKNTRNKKVVRYILFEIETQLSGQEYEFESNKYNIEHILPENPGAGWDSFQEENISNFIFRLGNMCLMEKTDNRDIGNSLYEIKKETYKESVFKQTKAIAENYDEWNEQKVESRQTQMAKQAIQIWKIS